ncbi:MAG: hypothetical protein DMG68_00010, partial [Acidobacteria bacterium]
SVISVRGGRYYLNYMDTGVQENKEFWWITSPAGVPGVPADLQLDSGYATPAAAQVVHDLTTRTYIQTDFSQFVRFAGAHNFKIGIGTAKNVNNVNSSWYGPEGRVVLYWNTMGVDQSGNPAVVPNICTICGATTTGTYGYYAVHDGATRGTAGSNITHFYVQDSWKVLNRLTINAGVRFEKETGCKEVRAAVRVWRQDRPPVGCELRPVRQWQGEDLRWLGPFLRLDEV